VDALDDPFPRWRRGVALVTGASRRIGRAVAEACAGPGVAVAVHHRGDADGAEETAERVRARGARAVVLRADLTDADACRGLVASCEEALGPLDLLVNNAARFERWDPDAPPEDDLDAHFAVNARAVHLLCAEAGRRMAARGGAIVNLADVAGLRPWGSHPGYSVSKAAAIASTLAWARALAPRVRVNAVAPGPVLPPAGAPPGQGEAAVARTLLGRWGSPAEVAEAVLFLAAAPYLTGVVLAVDGGRTLT
jgi:pteridine reductase